ncbi:ADP-forming succinate--CoA ligase subunit beta [Desulfobacter latus]|uniref:Succinate--CoA ligase [ADP-forming] subunit beta n=2 Tax=Desulfobacter latus TaxID=2292 RepID=A0A850T9P2_9BACT|nr:ADP-forming succinate--CoA ligase subunit beta [Desulfobacter latus]
MKLHEYQAKEILRHSGIETPFGMVAETADEVETLLEEMNISRGLVKAQVYAGGRGKAGGVKFFESVDQAREITDNMLHTALVTKQTGPGGELISKVLIEQPVEIAQEFYLAFLIDRANSCPIIFVSSEGGMEFEEVAKKFPDKILTLALCDDSDFEALARQINRIFQLDKTSFENLVDLIEKLYHIFVNNDCTLLEINPLAVCVEGGRLMPLDCKMNIDSNARFRQKKWWAYFNNELNEHEKTAAKYGLKYIKLDGNVGCMVNGAGLAMATMDTILATGHAPANFLDVGGSASEEAVTQALKIITSDPNVKTIFINIFGGIMKCDIIAQGIVNAVKRTGLELPLVVRLEGTHKEKGLQIIKDSGLAITSADSLAEGARLAAAAVKEA